MKKEDLIVGRWYVGVTDDKYFYIGQNSSGDLIFNEENLINVMVPIEGLLNFKPALRKVTIPAFEVEVPEWAIGYAVANNGSVCFYSKKPTNGSRWACQDGVRRQPIDYPNWEDSWTEI